MTNKLIVLKLLEILKQIEEELLCGVQFKCIRKHGNESKQKEEESSKL